LKNIILILALATMTFASPLSKEKRMCPCWDEHGNLHNKEVQTLKYIFNDGELFKVHEGIQNVAFDAQTVEKMESCGKLKSNHTYFFNVFEKVKRYLSTHGLSSSTVIKMKHCGETWAERISGKLD
jgi:hypothetical protein